MEGAWRAEAEVVVFLDSHIEAYGLVWQFSDPKTFTSKFSKNSDSFDSCFCNMYVYRFVYFFLQDHWLWCTGNIWLRVAVVSFQTPVQAPIARWRRRRWA